MKISKRQLVIAFVLCITSISVFLFIANAIEQGTVKHFDQPIIHVIQGLESSWLTLFFKTFTWIGSAYVVAPITLIAFLLLYFIYHRRGEAVLFVTLIIITVLSNELLKQYFKRERPEIYRIIDAGGLSFPSGHTMMAFSMYAIITFVLWRNMKSHTHQVILISGVTFMISMIAISRIYLGVHFPSDILGGLMASTFLVTLSITIFTFIQKSKNKLEEKEIL